MTALTADLDVDEQAASPNGDGDWPAGESEPERDRLRDHVLDRDELASLPRPRPLIADTLDLGTVSVLAGYYGTLKSFIALDWAASVATGRPWMGRATEQRRVLYVAAEGAFGLDSRLLAWEQSWGRGRRLDRDAVHVLPRPVQLGAGVVLELCALVREEKYGLVVVDTLAKCMANLDENSAQDMGRAVASLYAVQRATGGGSVLAVHHTGKDRSTIRGSSALEAGVDVVYTTEGDAALVTLSRTKRKDGPREDTHRVTFSAVDGTDSGVVMSAAGADMTSSQRDLISVVVSAFGATGASKAELRNAAGRAPATFHRALNALVSTGALLNSGTEQRPFYRVAAS